MDSRKSAHILYIPSTWPGGFLCIIIMWWVNLPSFIRIMTTPSSLLITFVKKIVGLHQYYKSSMLNLDGALTNSTNNNDRSK